MTTSHGPIPQFEPGTVVDGRYRIQAVIAAGGMGTVYRASPLSGDDSVALKVLHPDLRQIPSAVARFKREAWAVERLAHPNILRLLDFRESEAGLLYLVSELLDGMTLGEHLFRHGPMRPANAVRVASEVLAALEEVHAAGFVHRDLKPDNIFITRGTPFGVKVLDFGLVKLLEASDGLGRLTKTGTIGGTPRYTSPENALSQPIDGRSDLYSVGLLIYEMVTGQPPFEGETPVELALAHIEQRAPTMVLAQHPLPEPLVELVRQCLQKDPADRPQSSAKLRETLLAIAAEPIVALASPATPEHQTTASPWRGAGYLLWSAAAIVALVALAWLLR
ncbi:MAG: serine/threonine protein kinase [Myxococcota bacterium]